MPTWLSTDSLLAGVMERTAEKSADWPTARFPGLPLRPPSLCSIMGEHHSVSERIKQMNEKIVFATIITLLLVPSLYLIREDLRGLPSAVRSSG